MVSEITLADALNDVVDNRGKTCPTSEIGIALIATNCIKNSSLYPVFEKVRYVSNETYESWFRGHPQPGDLLFVTKGSPGRVCLVPETVNFCIAQDMVALRANSKKIDPMYLLAVLRSRTVQAKIENMHVGTLIPHFKKGDFDKLLLPLPERPLQEYIGKIYYELSKKIDTNEKMNETLEAMSRAFFRDWFLDFGPIYERDRYENFANLSLFPTELDLENECPLGWRKGVLGEIAVSRTRSVKPSEVPEDTTYIGLNHMPRRSISLGEWETAKKVDSSKRRFKKGEFLFGKLRPYFHKVGIAPEDGICSTDIVVVDGKEEHWRALVLQTISSDEFVAHTDRSSTGTKMPRTNWKDMARFEVVMPTKDVAKAFQEITEPLLERIIANIHENHTLSELRDLLLSKMLSGEVTLKRRA